MDLSQHHTLAWIAEWIRTYPSLTGLLIFAVAMSESLVIVGVLIPGALMMIGFGALIALGHLDFWTTMAWAIAGAVVGDGLSFWLGYFFHDRLLGFWPFSRLTKQLKRGEQFFHKHGGKSIAFGRFVGPVRAIIPTVAGMLGMSPLRFTVVNVISAIAWAPAYLLPGIVFGASLELASAVAFRVVALIMILILCLLVLHWLVKRTFNFLQPRADRIISASLNWARKHPWFEKPVNALVDPRMPESSSLLVFAALLVLAGSGFYLIVTHLASLTGASSFDALLYEWMYSLRTPWMDSVMVAITMLADTSVITGFAILIGLWLLAQRNIPAFLHWAAALVFGAILIRILKFSLQVPRPDPSMYSGTSGFSFPSAHTTMAMLTYGFLAVLITRELPAEKRMRVYLASGTLIFLIALSRLYLGAHWFSDVLGGLTLGLAWITLLGIAYRRHPSEPMPARVFLGTSLAALLLVAGTHTYLDFHRELGRYQLPVSLPTETLAHWQERDWSLLPVYREDLGRRNDHPFNLQWCGKLAAIENDLDEKGWHVALKVNFSNFLQWMQPDPSLEKLPLLPQAHQGRHESLAMRYHDRTRNREWVLRLWNSGYKNTSGDTIWVGSVSDLKLKKSMKLVSYPTNGDNFDLPLQVLQDQFPELHPKLVTRPGYTATHRQGWNGDVLLVCS